MTGATAAALEQGLPAYVVGFRHRAKNRVLPHSPVLRPPERSQAKAERDGLKVLKGVGFDHVGQCARRASIAES